MINKRNAVVRTLSIFLSLLMVLSVISFPTLKAKADGTSGTLDDFVERCYTVTLDRPSDADGFADWKGQLLNGKSVGFEIAYGFLFSKEYLAKDKDNDAYLKDLYMLFMGREPDENGYNDWMGKLNGGASRLEIFAGFANSPEFYNLCKGYGITAGRYTIGYDRQTNNNVNLFVERLYKVCLDRIGDKDGQANWVTKLITKQITGSECARSFIFSKEYENKGLSDEEFVENLYLAMFGRPSDEGGKQNWLNGLKKGMTRDEVFAGFANSQEFDNLCKAYGITRGNYVAQNKGTYDPSKPYSDDEIITLTMFTAMQGSEINDGNDIQKIIANKTGVKVKETWLQEGQGAVETVDSMIASGNLPDYIDGGEATLDLYEAGKLVAWDPYLEKYPNLKEMYSETEWNMFRQSDGKIYWANVFNNTYGKSKATGHNDSAFWVQVRVLEWAGYPEINTLDEYFDLLERYYKEHPSFVNAQGNTVDIIPYTTLCDDWRSFSFESAPQYLAGYPDDGALAVDPKTMKIVDYNVSPVAKTYFAKLNEEYQKGILDKNFATQTYEEYIDKLLTGGVLGMVDETWEFNYTVTPKFYETGLADLGCEYVPLGLTVDGVTDQRWHSYGDKVNDASGIAVTTSCKDPDRAFKFLNDILSQDIHNLRYWGVEGVDYLVDSNGLFYRTQEMRDNLYEPDYWKSHMCEYSFMPQWLGTSRDGKNAMNPAEQPSEFYAGLSAPLAKCFKAYNAGGYPDMIGSVEEDVYATRPWYPMWTWSNELNNDTKGGVAYGKITETKRKWLPVVVMSSNFETDWAKYMNAYNACKPQDFLNEAQEILDLRMGVN